MRDVADPQTFPHEELILLEKKYEAPVKNIVNKTDCPYYDRGTGFLKKICPKNHECFQNRQVFSDRKLYSLFFYKP